MSTKFYTYDQNNSGGYFIVNEDVDVYVIVEAESELEADNILSGIVEDYSDYCDCCGERWGSHIGETGTESPTIYGRPVDLSEEGVIIYYADGRKVKSGEVAES